MIRRKADAVVMFWFHDFRHCWFASSLMSLARADLSGLCLKSRPVVEFFAASLASWSARSFPSIPQWPGIHVIEICRCELILAVSSTLSKNSSMMDCPDCRQYTTPWFAHYAPFDFALACLESRFWLPSEISAGHQKLMAFECGEDGVIKITTRDGYERPVWQFRVESLRQELKSFIRVRGELVW